jgi:hypothetical protein
MEGDQCNIVGLPEPGDHLLNVTFLVWEWAPLHFKGNGLEPVGQILRVK